MLKIFNILLHMISTNLFLGGALVVHLPELDGVRDPGVGGSLGRHQGGVVLAVRGEELHVGLGALAHLDRALVHARAQVGGLLRQAPLQHRHVP